MLDVREQSARLLAEFVEAARPRMIGERVRAGAQRLDARPAAQLVAPVDRQQPHHLVAAPRQRRQSDHARALAVAVEHPPRPAQLGRRDDRAGRLAALEQPRHVVRRQPSHLLQIEEHRRALAALDLRQLRRRRRDEAPAPLRPRRMDRARQPRRVGAARTVQHQRTSLGDRLDRLVDRHVPVEPHAPRHLRAQLPEPVVHREQRHVAQPEHVARLDLHRDHPRPAQRAIRPVRAVVIDHPQPRALARERRVQRRHLRRRRSRDDQIAPARPDRERPPARGQEQRRVTPSEPPQRRHRRARGQLGRRCRLDARRRHRRVRAAVFRAALPHTTTSPQFRMAERSTWRYTVRRSGVNPKVARGVLPSRRSTRLSTRPRTHTKHGGAEFGGLRDRRFDSLWIRRDQALAQRDPSVMNAPANAHRGWRRRLDRRVELREGVPHPLRRIRRRAPARRRRVVEQPPQRRSRHPGRLRHRRHPGPLLDSSTQLRQVLRGNHDRLLGARRHAVPRWYGTRSPEWRGGSTQLRAGRTPPESCQS